MADAAAELNYVNKVDKNGSCYYSIVHKILLKIYQK